MSESVADSVVNSTNNDDAPTTPEPNPRYAGLNRKGRVPGSRNLPKTARDIIKDVVQRKAHNLSRWLRTIEAQQGAQAAMRAYLELAEYAVPKLARVEHTDSDGGPIQIQVSWMPSTVGSAPRIQVPSTVGYREPNVIDANTIGYRQGEGTPGLEDGHDEAVPHD